jgi:hypothetical protein
VRKSIEYDTGANVQSQPDIHPNPTKRTKERNHNYLGISGIVDHNRHDRQIDEVNKGRWRNHQQPADRQSQKAGHGRKAEQSSYPSGKQTD